MKIIKEGESISNKIDRVLTHKWLSIPIFLVILFLVFHLTFSEDLFFLGGLFEGVAPSFEGTIFEAVTPKETKNILFFDIFADDSPGTVKNSGIIFLLRHGNRIFQHFFFVCFHRPGFRHRRGRMLVGSNRNSARKDKYRIHSKQSFIQAGIRLFCGDGHSIKHLDGYSTKHEFD